MILRKWNQQWRLLSQQTVKFTNSVYTGNEVSYQLPVSKLTAPKKVLYGPKGKILEGQTAGSSVEMIPDALAAKASSRIADEVAKMSETTRQARSAHLYHVMSYH